MASLNTVCRGHVGRSLDTAPVSATDASAAVEERAGRDTSSTSLGPSTLTMTTFSEILPGIILLASANAAKNQCIIELARPGSGATTATRVPAVLQAALRVPRVIQVIPNDEGHITTIELVTDRAGSSGSGSTSKGTQGPSSSKGAESIRGGPRGTREAVRSPLVTGAADSGRSRALLEASDARGADADSEAVSAVASRSAPSLDGTFVHLFIGTSNGTVMVCNALRGTILAMAQFQYHHNFHALSHGEEVARSPSACELPSSAAASPSSHAFLRGRKKSNEAVARFVVQLRGAAASLRNPDLTIPVRGPGPASSFVPATAEDVGGYVSGVYAVHEGGRVVLLGRDVLDVFIATTVNHLDGQRPYFVLEWSPSSSLSSYPVAGPAASFAPLVKHVYTLEPAHHFSENELRTLAPSNTGTGSKHDSRSAVFSSGSGGLGSAAIRDAAFLFTAAAEIYQMESLLKRSAVDNVTPALLVCGSRPALALYPLAEERARFSATKAIKAVTSLVVGVARSLWYGGSVSAGGSRSTGGISGEAADQPERLERKPQDCRVAFLEGDVSVTRIAVDPTLQVAALYVEGTVTPGAGRLYLCDAHTGVIWRVLKGYRAATFVWWLAPVAGRSVLLLVVHLSQRGVVEVHVARRRQRLAACYVPIGSVLLRPSAGNCPKDRAKTSVAAAGLPPTLLTPTGELLELVIDLSGVETILAEAGWSPSALAGGPHGAATRTKDCRAVGDAPDTESLRRCRSPDAYLEAALQLHVPQWAVAARAADATAVRRSNVSSFRAYRRQLHSVCEALKRRYAPSYTEPRIIPFPTVADGAHGDAGEAAGVSTVILPPRGLGAAQVLNFIELRANLVTAYARLALAATSRRLSDGFGVDDVSRASLALLAEAGSGSTLPSGTCEAEDRATLTAVHHERLRETSGEKEGFSHCIGCSHSFGRHFWENAARQLCGVLTNAGRPTAAALLKAHAAQWRPAAVVKAHGGSDDACAATAGKQNRNGSQALRKSSPTPPPTSPERSEVTVHNVHELVDVEEFLSWFWCGGSRIQFRRKHLQCLDDMATTDRDRTRDLAALFYGHDGLDGFLRRFDVAATLGLDLRDLASLALTWIAAQCARDSARFLATNALGRLRLALATLPPEAFLSGLERVLLPLCERSTSVSTHTVGGRGELSPRWTAAALAGASHGLLLCCAAHLTLRNEALLQAPHTAQLATVTSQLVHLWAAAVRWRSSAPEKAPNALVPAGNAPETVSARTQSVEQIPTATDDSVAATKMETLGVRLHGLLPVDKDGGDTLEGYLMRRGLPESQCSHTSSLAGNSLVHAVLSREEVTCSAARRFPFTALLGVLLVTGAEPFVGEEQPPLVFQVAFPWLVEGSWVPDTYASLVHEPLAESWAMVCRHSNSNDKLQRAARTPLEQSWKALQQCCALLCAVAALQEAIRPLREANIPFWEAGTIPDVNLFSQVAHTVGGVVGDEPPRALNWLVGSRAHRDYLSSVAALSRLAREVTDTLLDGADEVRRVLLIQAITTALAADDDAAFPLVPRALRLRLRVLMQLLGQQPEALPQRVKCVASFARLLLFLTDAGTLSVRGRPVNLSGLASVRVPWRTLFGDSPSEAFMLFPSASLTSPSRTRMQGPPDSCRSSLFAVHSGSLATRTLAAVSLARNFLVKCVVPSLASAALASGTRPVDPQIVAKLLDEDTKRVMDDLCRSLDLDLYPGDLPAIFTFDAAVRYLCPTEAASAELAAISDRRAAARVAASDLRGLLGSCVKYCAAKKRYFLERQDNARFDAAADKLRTVLMAMSDRCKQWIQRPKVGTPASSSASLSPSSAVTVQVAACSDCVIGGEDWLGAEELNLMDRAVLTRLSAPADSTQRADFCALLFLLAQLASEGRAYLSTEAAAVASDLPAVIDSLRTLL